MKFRCKGCGYIADNEAPDVCPKCGAKKEMFEELAKDAAELIDKSRCTNNIHMEIVGLVSSADFLAKNGIDENLDPNCVKIFNYIIEQATIIRQMIKAEIATHISKGKWG